ncbi:ribonuclease H-like domain-containing protein [Rhizophagus irregularis DAOM 181602=DAOM 197198]|nr:ribonuclease H-like domain-containing protein [Rhizophagus irregularis DAOM 181602=DAOM 197198]
MSSGPSKVSKGRPPSDVWCNHMIQGNMQSRGHYSATCSYCRQYWRQGRPQVLSAHLANHCKKCPDDVSLYFAKIVGKNLAKEEEESADEDESDYPNKRVRQTGIKNFYGGGKIEKGRSDELDRVITKAYVMCNIPFSTIDNPWFIDMIKALEPGYDPPSRRVLNGTLLEAELSRVNARVNNELEKESNFTIALDDLSKNSHTAEYLSKVINDIICKVGISKIVAIVSDNAANVAGARRLITNEYPSIINIRCIAHCINLISSDIVKVDQVKCLVKRANILTRYFKNSTLASTWLKEAIDAKNIAGGGLKTYIETRWMTVHECTSSVYRLKDALLHVLDNHEREISNEAVKAILKKRGFFDDIRILSDILEPIKKAILMLEGSNVTLADCYLHLLRIAAFFKSMPTDDYKELRNSCISIFNKRYKEFDEDIYLLGFFLHPKYRGHGMRNNQFERLRKCALRIWKNLGHKKNSGLELDAQLRAYFDNSEPYNTSYSVHDTAYHWWNSIVDGKFSSLSRLAKVIFSITPHSASCERLFSAMGWLFGKRRINLQPETIETMAKIYLYSLKHAKKDLNYTSNGDSSSKLDDDIQLMLNTVFEEEEEIMSENDDDSFNEHQSDETNMNDETLDIESTVDLGPWVFIDNSILPTITRRYDSDGEEEWDPEQLN